MPFEQLKRCSPYYLAHPPLLLRRLVFTFNGDRLGLMVSLSKSKESWLMVVGEKLSQHRMNCRMLTNIVNISSKISLINYNQSFNIHKCSQNVRKVSISKFHQRACVASTPTPMQKIMGLRTCQELVACHSDV